MIIYLLIISSLFLNGEALATPDVIKLPQTFSIPFSNLDSVQPMKNCSMKPNKHLLIYCEDGDDFNLYFMTYSDMIVGHSLKTAMNGYLKFVKPLQFYQQNGKFINFIEPESNTFIEMEWDSNNLYRPSERLDLTELR